MPDGLFDLAKPDNEDDSINLTSNDGTATVSAFGTQNSSDLSADQEIEKAVSEHPDWQFTMKRQGPNWFAVSGYEGDKIFYEKGLISPNRTVYFLLEHNKTDAQKYSACTETLASTFKKL